MRKDRLVAMTTMAVATTISFMTPGCTTTGASEAAAHQPDKRHTIDTAVDSTLARLYTAANGSRELVGKARGVLVFPSVIAAGFGIGGQYGEGSLRAGGGTTGYYSTTTASIGWQIGAQSKAIIFLFMTQDSLDRFRNSEGWSVGGDASVAVLKVGANGNIDSSTATGPIQAFVLTNSGLMAGVTLEGTKVTKLKSL
ncbi:twin-arginine translocation pathway signal [Ralstonia solanacearum]|nr:twin-arginine translocation pathway signal [Ralstonia solanacearum]ARS57836.1 twin-arginine translocation pathway signal [Ralstonia solanacearum FJAT-91]ESS51177.1 lipoprotein [Ralstonia solanacearum SD54]MCK4149489.1 twin-arginine translocation pathway signal [Ralstonia pseudosolanacearum]AXV71096.1 twin-arginine translocation pathway signal [Ralstonia solanacearum]